VEVLEGSDVSRRQPEAATVSEQMRICPRCAEEVRYAAIVCRHCRFEFDATPDTQRYGRFFTAHATLAVSVAAFLYAVFQAYKVSDFEQPGELLRSAGLTTILVGVFLVELPLIVILGVLGMCWMLISAARSERVLARYGPSGERSRVPSDPRTVPTFLIAALLVIAFYTTPWTIFLLSLVIYIGTLLIAYRRHRRERALGRYTRWLIVVVALFFAYFLLEREAIWVPEETVVTTNQGTIVAFVIQADETWTTLLTPQWAGIHRPDRDIVSRIRTTDVITREPCARDYFEGSYLPRSARLRPVQLWSVYVVNHGVLPEPLTPRCPY
jgi:hypothetical protein